MSLTKCRDCGMEVDTEDPWCLCHETDAANRTIGAKILIGIRRKYESEEWQNGVLAEILGRVWVGQDVYLDQYIREAEK